MNLRKQLSSYIALNNYVEAIRENTSSIVLTDAITNGLTDLQLKGSEVKNKPETFLDSVVAKGGTEQRNLPVEYTQLEYITFPNGAYIKTGIIPNTYDYEVGFKGAFGILSGGPNCAWGYMGDGVIPRWLCATYRSSYLLNANTTIGFGDADTNTHTFVGRIYEKNGNHCWSSEVDGVIEQNDQTLNHSSAWEANTLEIYVGARNNAETAGNPGLITANHWWCKKAEVMIADYIPAKRNSDNVLGMYDTVSGTFFTNQGTGSFVAGPEVVPTPDAPMDIVCNNGVLKVGPNNGVIVEGTPETVTITGKNLYDVTKDTTDKYIGKDGSIGNDSYSCYSGLIPVKEGESYTYSGVCNIGATTANNKRIHGYVNGIWNQQITVIAINENTPFYATFTIPTGINGIRISHWYKDENTQVEEGIRPTKYEEYYQASFTPEDLLKLSDYQDVQNVLDGVVTRNVGVKVLTGAADEQWGTSVSTKFYWDTDFARAKDYSPTLCTCYQAILTDRTAGVGDNQIALFTNYNKGRIVICDPRFTTVEQFKQWLADQYAAGTPVIVVYPLANAVEETVESRDVFITSGTNTIERNSEYVASDGITVKYKKLR